MKKYGLILALAVLAAGLFIAPAALAQDVKNNDAGAPSAENVKPVVTIPSFAPVVKKAEAAVVNISTVKVSKGRGGVMMQRRGLPRGFGFDDDFFNDPFMFDAPQGDRKEKAQGSGFIFDPKGYIVTNNHVIEDATEIIVKLMDNREIKAEIIGRDPKTDLALIKLTQDGEYPYINLGDSAKLEIGDWVVAIGNPLGLDHTVTAGILSAKGRKIKAGPYDDFLQTDASINFGNSGGPLLNLEGEVIGINTAISAVGSGIGFAIPSNMAKGIIDQLKSGGRVVRGWLGVGITQVTPDMAQAFGLPEAKGVIIHDVFEDGPAKAAGIKAGDIVLKFDGQDIQDLPAAVAGTSVGKKVQLVIFRDGKEMTVDLTVAEMKDESLENTPGAAAGPNLGLKLRDLTPELARGLGLKGLDSGVVIAGVEPDSIAQAAGLTQGDVIVEVDRKPVKTAAEFENLIKGKKKDEVILLFVNRGGSTRYVTIKVE